MGYTKEQSLAIDTEGQNIIVSAGAGSGKTAVLTERVIRKLKDGIDINKLLILTFTNEAANEMKNRIRKAIFKNDLTKQLDLIDSAYITTFDSYSFSLVKKYHYLLNISNNIKITTSGIITIYKHKKLTEIMDNMYGNSKFDKLINDFCLKDDKVIKDFILYLSDKIDLIYNKDEYLNNYIGNYYNDSYLNILVDKYNNLVKNKISELDNLYETFKYYCTDKLISNLDNWFKPLFSGHNIEQYNLFLTIPSVRFIGVNEEGIEYRDQLKELISEIKDLLRFKNNKEIVDSIKNTASYIEVIIEILKELDREVLNYKTINEIYEFNDISRMAIDIVKNNIDIREEIKNSFNEIMIDEYQDTSNNQEEFINYISNNNVYMVGDIKQSIYRFRNANPYIFRDKYNKYANSDGGINIDLLDNFRSRKEVLCNINEIFNLIMDEEIGDADYINYHNMRYGNIDYDREDNKCNNNLEIYNYHSDKDDKYFNYEKEIFIVAEDIKKKIKDNYQVYDKDKRELRNITYSDICIITDRNKYLNIYKKVLEYHMLPSVVYMDLELSMDMVILVIKNLITLIYHVKNKLYDRQFQYVFTSVARSFIFDYDDDSIYNIIKNNTYGNTDIIKQCYDIDINRPLPVIINDILDKFMVYDRLTTLTDIDANIIRIDNLLDIADSLNDLGYSLKDFIDYLCDASELALPIKYSVNTNSNDAIKIMNIHKSKGLEFSLCYYLGLDNRFSFNDISSRYLFSNDYGIIVPYLNNDEIDNTILRDLYSDNYYREEISEKIRLFYVALTRCREKMIIVTSLADDRKGYSTLVPLNNRLKYRSFLDILNSVEVIDKYVINKEAKYTKDYNKINLKEIKENNCHQIINKKEINIDYHLIDNNKFSKGINDLISIDMANKLEYGRKMHEVFEYDDFNNPHSDNVKNLLQLVDNKFINIYREYEFMYIENGIKYRGVIDLMLEYDDYIYIIDYKLKDIDKEEYSKQLNGYRKYIESISNKLVKVFLYSISDNILTEVI